MAYWPLARRVTLPGADLRRAWLTVVNVHTVWPSLLFANTDVVARHEAPGVPVIQYLDTGQPFDVSHTVPTRGDQAHGEPVLSGQRHAVHLVAEQVLRVECFSDRHAAGELLGNRQIQVVLGVGVNLSRTAFCEDSDFYRESFPCRYPHHRKPLRYSAPGHPPLPV